MSEVWKEEFIEPEEVKQAILNSKNKFKFKFRNGIEGEIQTYCDNEEHEGYLIYRKAISGDIIVYDGYNGLTSFKKEQEAEVYDKKKLCEYNGYLRHESDINYDVMEVWQVEREEN